MHNLKSLSSPLDCDPEDKPAFEPFESTLARHGLTLKRSETTILQVNLGLLCNQVCRHCHLEAGPNRSENMSFDDAEQVVEYARRNRFETIDLTGGAPELNPNLPYLISELSHLTPRILIRSNLSALTGEPAGVADSSNHTGGARTGQPLLTGQPRPQCVGFERGPETTAKPVLHLLQFAG